MKEKEILTDTPLNPEISIRSDLNSENPFGSRSYYAGDSVDEHKKLEEANQYIAEEELQQQNDNNSL
ncbi:hypothetical protein ACFOU2_01120 [Bacillus songklensis]|uniref:Uncharacterized protein n=1 Tax=Bacillus songklensis TaxID=1069116 RepID=A0ABV8AX09_9BACI